MSKGQLATTDFYVASIIFLILIIAIMVNLNTYPIILNENQDKNEMLITLLQFSDSLVKSPGDPTAWEDNLTILNVIGLAESDKILSTSKVNSFINLSYNVTKNHISFYDFYFRILDYNNTQKVTYGLPYNGTSSITTRRYVIYNGQKAIIELTIWK